MPVQQWPSKEPTVTPPNRESPLFWATAKVMAPLPTPLVPDVIEIHDAVALRGPRTIAVGGDAHRDIRCRIAQRGTAGTERVTARGRVANLCHRHGGRRDGQRSRPREAGVGRHAEPDGATSAPARTGRDRDPRRVALSRPRAARLRRDGDRSSRAAPKRKCLRTRIHGEGARGRLGRGCGSRLRSRRRRWWRPWHLTGLGHCQLLIGNRQRPRPWRLGVEGDPEFHGAVAIAAGGRGDRDPGGVAPRGPRTALDARDLHGAGPAGAGEVLIAGADRELARRSFLPHLDSCTVDDHLSLPLGTLGIRPDAEGDLAVSLTRGRRQSGDPAGLR